MSNFALSELAKLDGFIAVTLVDTEVGMSMASEGSTATDPEMNAVAATEVYRSMTKAIDLLQLNDKIEDTLVSLGDTYQLIRPLHANPKLVIHLAMRRAQSNLALARRALSDFESSHDFSVL
ncbi:MAG: hypothetical protein Q4G42_02150 [Neisseria sp.]|nr:hypothetical protein [Neisseria sp.]